uniref:Uncharacterized protein n=1 Tax=Phenylobacterium glaciei TaxID=2803784 RepID=A0A974P206_9CAUL|nr:hypothetical protein JKL49_16860 [Phenylobacterium glaciei]
MANLPDQGAPNGIELSKLAGSINGSLIESAVNYAVKVTGISEAEPILLPDGRTTNLGEVKLNYRGLWARWATAVGATSPRQRRRPPTSTAATWPGSPSAWPCRTAPSSSSSATPTNRSRASRTASSTM